VLSRGYAICLRQRDRKAVRVWSDVERNERVEVVLGAGALGCEVVERREERG
jgi:exonuclease VII large subunit